jgi:nitroreductase
VLVDAAAPTGRDDGNLVIENMLLAAADLGLGGCYIYRAKEEFESPEGKEILKKAGIEGDYVGVGHVILGFPDMTPKAAPRKENYIYRL